MAEITKDALQIYMGEDLVINENLVIKQALIDDIIKSGEEQYFSAMYTLTSVPSDFIYFLDQNGLDWMEIHPVHFFYLISNQIPVENTRLVFGGLDFRNFSLYKKDDGEFVMVNEASDILIDKPVYEKIFKFLAVCHLQDAKQNIKAGNESTKQAKIEIAKSDYLRLQREAAERLAKGETRETKSTLQALISSMVNHENFKYNIQDVRKLTFFQFMDSVSRIQQIQSAESLIGGIYAGNVDAKKVSKSSLDWMGHIERTNEKLRVKMQE